MLVLVLVVVVVVSMLQVTSAQSQGLSVNISGADAYQVYWNSQLLFSSAPPFVRVNGQVSTSLTLESTTSTSGSDVLGDFKLISYDYSVVDDIHWNIWTKQYSGIDAIVFGQTWPQAVSGTQASTTWNAETLEPIAGFPCFSYHTGLSDKLVWNTWNGPQMNFYGTNNVGLSASTFPRNNALSVGPHILVNSATMETFVLSAFDNFQVSACADTTYNNNNFWSCGLVNTIEGIPANYSSSYIIYAGYGVTNTMYLWGQAMQKWYQTSHIPDIKLQKLGYYTDNGAYYAINEWTNPTFNNSGLGTIDELFTKLVADIKNKSIPLVYMSLDGWWYVPPQGGGSPLHPLPNILPGGLGALSKALGMPLDVYSNGFADGDITVPNWVGWAANYFPNPNVSYQWYQEVFTNWKQQGMGTYEIDFMNSIFTSSPVLFGSLTGAFQFLQGQAKAAEEVQTGIQYCGTFGKQALETLNYAAVTNIRVSNDFDCWDNYWMPSSILTSSLGVASSKDTFWTTSDQPNPQNMGCYGLGLKNHNNTNVELHTVLVSLTDGPVGFSDALGYTNATLVMTTCNSEGTLLHPSKTVTLIDTHYTPIGPKSFSECAADPVTPCYAAIYQSHSSIPFTSSSGAFGNLIVHFLVNIAVQDYQLSANDLWPPVSGVYYYHEWHIPCPSQSEAGACMQQGFPKVTFDSPFSSPLEFNWNYYIFSPQDKTGWIFLGEMKKVTTVSPNRITKLQFNETSLQAYVVGAPNEVVELTAINPKNIIIVLQITLDQDGNGICSF